MVLSLKKGLVDIDNLLVMQTVDREVQIADKEDQTGKDRFVNKVLVLTGPKLLMAIRT